MPTHTFFADVQAVKEEFARLIHCGEPGRIALTPSASYGVATAAANLPVTAGRNIIVVEGQFPSNYYAWDVLCKQRNAELRVVPRPSEDEADTWSERVVEAVDSNTAAVAIAQLHWADGTLYDLQAIRTRTDEVDAWLIVDGTQSLGAFPFDVRKIRPDALVAGGYKWLMGPYGCGYAYYGERMDDGRPIEENWINRAGSDDFRNLVNYRDDYRPLAARYSVGEHSNFLIAPMQVAALQQVNGWTPEGVQEYTAGLWSATRDLFERRGVTIPEQRAHHLVGLRLPGHIDQDRLVTEIDRRGLTVSYRGDKMRVSPNVYNTPEELAELAGALKAAATRTA